MTRNPETGSSASRRFATVGTLALGTVLLSSGVALADQTEEEARERYEQLQEELSTLNEAYNQAQEDHESAEAEVADLEDRVDEAEESLEEMSGQVSLIAQSAYTGTTHSLPGVLFDSSPDQALQNIADLDFLSVGQEAVLSDYVDEVDRSERLLAQATEAEDRAAESLKEAETSFEQGEEALEEQEEVLESLGGVDPTSSASPAGGGGGGGAEAAASGDVQAVLDFARDQIGKPYVWGGTGPDGFDCSGLTQAAWSQAGVDLPRTTFDQVNAGTQVSRDEVEPGDLLFFYDAASPSHVGIYSGNGQMIHGSNPSKPLEEVDLADYWDGVFTTAVRVG